MKTQNQKIGGGAGDGILSRVEKAWEAHLQKNFQTAGTTGGGDPSAGQNPPAADPGKNPADLAKNSAGESLQKSPEKSRRSELSEEPAGVFQKDPSPAPRTQDDGGFGAAKNSPADLKKLSAKYEEGQATIRDLLAPSSMKIEFDHLEISGVNAQSFFVSQYPRNLEVDWLWDLVNADTALDLSVFLYPVDTARIMKQLKTQSGRLASSLAIGAEKGSVRDPALEEAYQNVEELRDLLQRGQEKFFQSAVYFTVYDEDRMRLARTSKELEAKLGGKLIFTKRADLRAEQGFNSCLPQATDELGVRRNLNTGPLSTTFPFVSSELTADDGIMYGINLSNETLVIFDRFSLENANQIVLATSGAGKSFAVKLEILRSMMFGTEIIVIDPEREYQPLCDALGGSYIDISLKSDQRINPFDLPVALGDDETVENLLRQAVISLEGLLRLMLGELSNDEIALLDQAILDTYALRGITFDTADLENLEMPTMSDLVDVLDSMTGGSNLAKRLRRFTTGTFGGIFNQPTNISAENPFVAFSTRDLDEELRPMAVYIIMNYIWNLVRGSRKKRQLVIDEAWSIMEHDDSARFLAGLVRRARKYWLGITTITQFVGDFVDSPYGRPIIENAACSLLLKQSPTAIEKVQEVFHLTDNEKFMLMNADRGQGIFFAGLKHVALQIYASDGEEKLITTDPEEIFLREAEGADLRAAIPGA